MKQPESKFKHKVDEYFDRLFGVNGYSTPIDKGKCQKSGLPDRYYSALGGHCWAESKVAPYHLSPLQAVVLPRMARAGSRVVALTLLPSQTVKVIQFDPQGEERDALLIPLEDFKSAVIWKNVLLAPSSSHRGVA